jgi:predicted DNA-binding antitoxin AbrB/MazE fold protein
VRLGATGAILTAMRALKARVENGRLKLDEPTDLPDGAELEVVVIDDELSPDERAELHASLDRALDDSDAERGVDAWEYLEQYRARREGRPA